MEKALSQTSFISGEEYKRIWEYFQVIQSDSIMGVYL
jgi:hypothetical protein